MKEVFQELPLFTPFLRYSIGTFALWFYTILNMRTEKLMPQAMIDAMQENLNARKANEALAICQKDPSLLSRMLHSGLLVSHASPREVMESMQSEGKRVSSNLWQKLGLLNDVAVVAPMIGLLGTVVGMFYAFYDINRSLESMNALFDGLGISVGTTVAGLILAILALGLHSMSKYRLIKQITKVEFKANSLIAKLHRDLEKEEQKEQTT
jgi:biopolymer transport protein ExbB